MKVIRNVVPFLFHDRRQEPRDDDELKRHKAEVAELERKADDLAYMAAEVKSRSHDVG